MRSFGVLIFFFFSRHFSGIQHFFSSFFFLLKEYSYNTYSLTSRDCWSKSLLLVCRTLNERLIVLVSKQRTRRLARKETSGKSNAQYVNGQKALLNLFWNSVVRWSLDVGTITNWITLQTKVSYWIRTWEFAARKGKKIGKNSKCTNAVRLTSLQFNKTFPQFHA